MIGIIDYGIGNLGSVTNALKKLDADYLISSDPLQLINTDLLILPGVGNASEGMANLKKRNLDKVLIDQIKRRKPFLGICLGMQLLFDESEEGRVACLGILKGEVKKFQKERKVPQIGWNQVLLKNENQLNLSDKSYFYFVNSYYCLPDDKSIIAGESVYGEKFPSIIVKDNIVATQFHPEKSGRMGFLLLKSILNKYAD